MKAYRLKSTELLLDKKCLREGIMQYDVTVIRKTYFDFRVEADTADDAVEAAYDAYSEAVAEETLDEHYGDEDLDYDDIIEVEEW